MSMLLEVGDLGLAVRWRVASLVQEDSASAAPGVVYFEGGRKVAPGQNIARLQGNDEGGLRVGLVLIRRVVKEARGEATKTHLSVASLFPMSRSTVRSSGPETRGLWGPSRLSRRKPEDTTRVTRSKTGASCPSSSSIGTGRRRSRPRCSFDTLSGKNGRGIAAHRSVHLDMKDA